MAKARAKKAARPTKAAKPKAKKAAKKPAKCAAKTKSGKACRNYAVGRSKFCKLHQKKR